ncbi:hypothetical protein SAMN05421766_102290 [Zobellia uliginosa]|uniref:Uncharacterized protein n=1 Tax=Zobellia uliginosa TaxID=143224 RepID=A0ABY1KLY7_9FLAO|nr:hypothetical protein SAMN05421766_102290 [Zobellia uliginosa]
MKSKNHFPSNHAPPNLLGVPLRVFKKNHNGHNVDSIFE